MSSRSLFRRTRPSGRVAQSQAEGPARSGAPDEVAIRSARCSAGYCVVSRTAVPLLGELLGRLAHLDACLGQAISSSRITSAADHAHGDVQRRRMPPEYVDTFREAVGEVDSRKVIRHHVPGAFRCRIGNQHQVLANGRICIDSSELSGRDSDRFSNPERFLILIENPLTVAVPASGWQQRGQDAAESSVWPYSSSREGEDAASASKSTPRRTCQLRLRKPCTG